MDNTAKTIQNSSLAQLGAGAPRRVLNSIRKASLQTGVDFSYLLKQAKVESSFNPTAKAKTSSASGLYQFLDSTWISMVKKYGDKYGMGNLADQISDSGKVSNRSVKRQILSLRNDPEKAAAMAAEFANENERYLKSNWGGEVGPTELYLAHFMGAGGASEFLKARDENPLQSAAVLFPAAAKANRNVFYDTGTGRAKSLDEVYAFFDKKFDMENIEESDDANSQVAQADYNPYSPQSIIFTNARPGGFAPPRIPAGQPLLANPMELILLAQMDLPGQSSDEKSLFSSSRYND